ncbi:unnamed protein product, partial [Closterium sp. NIES-53]
MSYISSSTRFPFFTPSFYAIYQHSLPLAFRTFPPLRDVSIAMVSPNSFSNQPILLTLFLLSLLIAPSTHFTITSLRGNDLPSNSPYLSE